MSVKKNKNTENYSAFIKQLSALSGEELLDEYAVAKTGDQRAVDHIPVRIIEAFNEVQKWLDDYNTNNILRNLSE